MIKTESLADKSDTSSSRWLVFSKSVRNIIFLLNCAKRFAKVSNSRPAIGGRNGEKRIP